MTTATDYLSTYLQDHRAGAEMGVNLARRLADENVDTPYTDFLTLLARRSRRTSRRSSRSWTASTSAGPC